MHSSRMRTVRLLNISCSAWGICRTPLDADPPSIDADPPPLMQTPWMQIPPGQVTCDVCREANPPTPAAVDRRNDTRLWKYYLTNQDDYHLSSLYIVCFADE